jgi:hypothetical protein
MVMEEYYLYTFVPLLLLHMLNLVLAHVPISLIEPLIGVWNWKRFEDFEALFDLVKLYKSHPTSSNHFSNRP